MEMESHPKFAHKEAFIIIMTVYDKLSLPSVNYSVAIYFLLDFVRIYPWKLLFFKNEKTLISLSLFLKFVYYMAISYP
jgi:hypothetical protein